jgi:hypothetical protein
LILSEIASAFAEKLEKSVCQFSFFFVNTVQYVMLSSVDILLALELCKLAASPIVDAYVADQTEGSTRK